ncbi:hypothetical protein ZIOFF_067418 [Zingiber officinale]|uniref:Uncharacterized protein n=1 Tax=Zingiber officinale TaxID=94328 RepID=A0A8J5CDA6_ZINOF|nr:hypothetical protein ZIOFF_067418 [Zingiber officinale]
MKSYQIGTSLALQTILLATDDFLVGGTTAEDVVLRTEKAPGNCPFCSGAVTATDIESSWRLCCLPLCRKIKRNFSCSECSRRLVVSSSLY